MTGDEIRRWRSANRVKQEALANMLGVSHAAISQWENGRARPSKVMAMRLSEVMARLHEGQLAAEIAFVAPQLQVKALTRGENLQLVAISAGYRALWPDMAAFVGKDMRPLLMNEALHYVEDSDYMKEALRGDLLVATGVSNRFLSVGGDVPDDFRFRWHLIARRIDGEIIHETVFEPCATAMPVGFEHVLRRSEIRSARD